MYYLGTIAVGAGAAQNNTTTASAFTIESSASDLYLQSDTAGVQFEMGRASAFQTTATRGAFLPGANVVAGPYYTGEAGSVVVSVWNPTAGAVNVRVYAGGGA